MPAALAPDLATRSWLLFGGVVVRLPGFEGQHGHAGGQLRRVQPLPQPAPQAFGGQQVELGVEVSEPAPVRGDRALVQVAQVIQDGADPVERPGDHVGTGRHAAFQAGHLPLQPGPLLRLPGVHVAVGAAVAGMLAQLTPQPGDPVRPAARRPPRFRA